MLGEAERRTLEFSGSEAAGAWRSAGEDEPAARLFNAIGPDGGFSASFETCFVGEVIVADVRAQPLLLRDGAVAGERGPLIFWQAVVEGRPTFHSGDGEGQVLKAGQVVVRPPDPQAVLRSDRFTRVITVAAPRHLFAPRYAAAEDLAVRQAPVEDGLAARLLYALITGLETPSRGLGRQPVRLVELLGSLTALIVAQKAPLPIALSDLAAARAGDILAYLQRNFANPQLDPQTLADDLSISVRYAHKLMQMNGRSLRETLTDLRLAAARQAFAANRRPRQTIADIAISVGFNDLSQFNRRFRAAFGMTPRAARRLDELNGYDPPTANGLGEGAPAMFAEAFHAPPDR